MISHWPFGAEVDPFASLQFGLPSSSILKGRKVTFSAKKHSERVPLTCGLQVPLSSRGQHLSTKSFIGIYMREKLLYQPAEGFKRQEGPGQEGNESERGVLYSRPVRSSLCQGMAPASLIWEGRMFAS